MSEIQKLRELLEEARLWVAYCDAFIIMRNGVGWSEQKVLLQKIDDALLQTANNYVSIPLLAVDEEADKSVAEYEKTLKRDKLDKQVLWSQKDEKQDGHDEK